MLIVADPIRLEFERWCTLVGSDDPYAGVSTLGILDVLRAHFLIADFFYEIGEGLGGIGPRDLNLLHSAVSRQFTEFGSTRKWANGFETCATLFYGLIKDHPFHDANKRTAFLSALYYLHKMGRCPTAPQDEFERLTVEVADDQLIRNRRFRELENKSNDPEVMYVSDFFRRHTREIDKRYYAITFKELAAVLRRHGYSLENPSGNYIDVVKHVVKKPLIGFWREPKVHSVKIAQIGFPGWTREVNKGAIKTVRRETELDAEHGVDSKTFFFGYDPMSSLIASYEEPLRRLAHR